MKTSIYQKDLMYNIDFNGFLLLFFSFMLPLSRAVDSIFIIFFSVYFIFYVFKDKSALNTLRRPLSKAIIIFVVYSAISIFWSPDHHSGVTAFRMYIRWIAIFGVALYICKYPERVQKVLSFFLLGMFVSEILSYGMILGLWTIHGKGGSDPAPFMSHIEYSVYLAFTAVILLNRIYSNRYNLKEKILLGIFFSTVTVNLFFSGGRTGQLAFFVAMVLIYFIHNDIKFKNFLAISTVALLLFGAAYNLIPQFKNKIDTGMDDIKKAYIYNDFDSSLGLRIAQYIVGFDNIKNHPIIGVGIGGKKEAQKMLFDSNHYKMSENVRNFIINSHAHNLFLQILIEEGVIGLILLIAIFICLLRLDIPYKEFKELSIAFTIVYLVSLLPEPLWLRQFSNTLFILFVGIFLGLSVTNEKDCSNE